MAGCPQSQREFDELVASEEACRAYWAALRWPNGFVCPQCSGAAAWRLATGAAQCRACGRQTSLTAGTLFQDTRTPLSLWFRAIWYVVGQKSGTSAQGLQRLLGLGSYHTAWTWLHRLRRAMVRPGREALAGCVQVDETYWGAAHAGKRGRGADGKTVLFVAVEHTASRLGRVRLLRVADAGGAALCAAVRACVHPGSVVETDGMVSYRGLAAAGYTHHVLRDATPDLLPQVHLVVSLLKRWLLGTHHGAVRASHLDYYLDEFTFRFNRRTAQARGLLFHRLLQYAVSVPPLREADLRAPPRTHYR